MSNKLLTGVWQMMLEVPPVLWEKQIEKRREKVKRSTAFMSPIHRQIHYFVVRELPRLGEPLPPERVARELNLPLEETISIIKDLEEHLTFLYRNEQEEIIWAYPVTVERTPHRITFVTGEHLYAAWAVDAFATPFVQGRLRQEPVCIRVETECAHCKEPMQLEVDSNMNCRCPETDIHPIIFVPEVDFSRLKEPNIIETFWKESVFFRSEEHARAYRKEKHRLQGAYFTTDQIAYLNKTIQSALFGW